MESLLFTPAKIGPLELKNRVIRASAYEGMCDGHVPTQQLKDYHTALARGGVGMTGVAYASIDKSGLSFHRQLWMRPEIIPGLRDLTDSIHSAGAKACIQLGHCGNMSHRMYCGQRPVGASSGFNLYSPTFVHGLREDEIHQIVKDFGNAVRIARDGGFDAVEIHAGHGYLISQFLSPYTNHRKDKYGGPLENRMIFMDMVMEEVMKAAGDDIAVLVKTNTRDGFKGRRIQRRSGAGGLHKGGQASGAGRSTVPCTKRRIRQQGTDVRDARGHARQCAYGIHALETMVAKAGGQSLRQDDD